MVLMNFEPFENNLFAVLLHEVKLKADEKHAVFESREADVLIARDLMFSNRLLYKQRV